MENLTHCKLLPSSFRWYRMIWDSESTTTRAKENIVLIKIFSSCLMKCLMSYCIFCSKIQIPFGYDFMLLVLSLRRRRYYYTQICVNKIRWFWLTLPRLQIIITTPFSLCGIFHFNFLVRNSHLFDFQFA